MKSYTKMVAGVVVAACTIFVSACGGGTTSNGEGGSSASGNAANNAALTVTDVQGREVSFDKQPERIILAEGRGVFATSILDKDKPFDKVVARGSDLKTAAPSFYEELEKAVPETKDIPEIGNMAKGDVTVENLLSYNPDVVIMTADHYKASETNGMLTKMDDAGIKYVVTDFRQHPLTNTTKSIELLGKIFDKEDKAEAFNKDWTDTVDRVKETAAKADKKPKTFLWRAAGWNDCCATVKESNLGELVNVAGGDNMGDHILDSESGDITPEKVIAEQPEKIIATGGSWVVKPDKNIQVPYVTLGYKGNEEQAKQTLEGLTATPGFDQLDAPKNKEMYGVWHQFYDSPFNFLALEQFGVWLQPDLFKDVDVTKHYQEAHEKYLPFPNSGVLFVSQNG